MHNSNQNGFRFSYSAKEQEEIKKIREKYTLSENKEDDKMALLRRLDKGVTQKAQAVSLVFGVLGALILGFGMSLIMSELSTALGLQGAAPLVLGVIFGVIGGTLAALAYPAYNFVIKRERKRVAPKILSLTEELMK
jgi:hypothetical protein